MQDIYSIRLFHRFENRLIIQNFIYHTISFQTRDILICFDWQMCPLMNCLVTRITNREQELKISVGWGFHQLHITEVLFVLSQFVVVQKTDGGKTSHSVLPLQFPNWSYFPFPEVMFRWPQQEIEETVNLLESIHNVTYELLPSPSYC